jgi:hypothetical protein
MINIFDFRGIMNIFGFGYDFLCLFDDINIDMIV